MLHVLYDSQVFSRQEYGGISRYFHELIHHLAKHKDILVELNVKFSNNSYIKYNDIFKGRSFFPNKYFIGKYRLLEYSNILFELPSITKKRYDIFHPTYYNPYFIKLLGRKPYVLTVYDMIHERFGEIQKIDRKLSERKRYLSRHAKKIIAISENTKKDLIQHFGVDPEKIKVIYLGTSVPLDPTNCKTPPLPEEYILYVGIRSYYKNFARFIRSMAMILKRDERLSIVCAGGGKFNPKEIELFKELGIRERVHNYSPTDNLLWCLYRNAKVFVFPSLYEGFGIPVLEAFACGCPVALSNSSSLPEIAREAALYFDPMDLTSIGSTVSKTIYDNNLRSILIQKGLERVKDFSWEKNTLETKEIYQSIIDK